MRVIWRKGGPGTGNQDSKDARC
jgi:hypothetical protein